MLGNPEYTERFEYYGPEVDNRAYLIVDDDDNEDNDFEQSDLVLVLLNLANIPDQVAK